MHLIVFYVVAGCTWWLFYVGCKVDLIIYRSCERKLLEHLYRLVAPNWRCRAVHNSSIDFAELLATRQVSTTFGHPTGLNQLWPPDMSQPPKATRQGSTTSGQPTGLYSLWPPDWSQQPLATRQVSTTTGHRQVSTTLTLKVVGETAQPWLRRFPNHF